ncbi:MAG: 50S ribosomal protein L15 [Chlamydiae bacterium]|nr:50S ribosomal protein L15 [Chlamydiota bacterium]
MLTLNTLKNVSRPKKARKRVGRGSGSGLGKTSGRGNKGDGSRSGRKQRLGYEGGQFPLFRKLPVRGFSNAEFKKNFYILNLQEINNLFVDGEVVSESTLREKRILKGRFDGIKILGNGTIDKKVIIEAQGYSTSAKEKLDAAKISYSIIA